MKKSIQKNIPIILLAFFIVTIICLRIFVAIGGKATELVLSDTAKSALDGFVFEGAMTDGKVTHYLNFDNGNLTNKFTAKPINLVANYAGQATIRLSLADETARKNAKIDDMNYGGGYVTQADSALVMVELYGNGGKIRLNSGLIYEQENLTFTAYPYHIDGKLSYQDFEAHQGDMSNNSSLLTTMLNDKAYFAVRTRENMKGKGAIWRVDEFLDVDYLEEKEETIYLEENPIVSATTELGTFSKFAELEEISENYQVIGVFTVDNTLALLTQENNKLMITLYSESGDVLDKQILHDDYKLITKGEQVSLIIRNMQSSSEVCLDFVPFSDNAVNVNHKVIAIKAQNGKITNKIFAQLEGPTYRNINMVFSQNGEKLLVEGGKLLPPDNLVAEFVIFDKQGNEIFKEPIKCGVTDDGKANNGAYRQFFFNHKIYGTNFYSTAQQVVLKGIEGVYVD